MYKNKKIELINKKKILKNGYVILLDGFGTRVHTLPL